MKNRLYDSGVFIGFMTDECVEKELKSGFIKKVETDHKDNIYQTNINFRR